MMKHKSSDLLFRQPVRQLLCGDSGSLDRRSELAWPLRVWLCLLYGLFESMLSSHFQKQRLCNLNGMKVGCMRGNNADFGNVIWIVASFNILEMLFLKNSCNMPRSIHTSDRTTRVSEDLQSQRAFLVFIAVVRRRSICSGDVFGDVPGFSLHFSLFMIGVPAGYQLFLSVVGNVDGFLCSHNLIEGD
mmetsp:Transcript_92352/g.266596  ORF Transcript_92352/g.266596 Transcript_92352/m.266596 type:complete len:188 (+) Transcript_92352:153-716(+)